MSRRLLVVAVICGLFFPGPSGAVPTLRGATGLILVPVAAVTRSTAATARSGKIVPAYTQSLGFAEFGVMNANGRTLYDLKLAPVPDVSDSVFFIPAMAVGVRGIASTNEDREFYFVASKKFSFPESTVTLGISRAQTWSKGQNSLFYGIDLPLFAGLSLVADHDGRDKTSNVGARWVFGKTFCIYDYMLDAFRKGATATRQNVIGICYQNQF